MRVNGMELTDIKSNRNLMKSISKIEIKTYNLKVLNCSFDCNF